MAGLQSQNISVASAHLLGEAYLERNTCVFCRRRATPSLSDPHAPLFALFSLVDCRHYVCQPCALVNCDNDGRLIECPQCHCISRLAQTGRKRTSASLPHRSSGNDDGDEKARRGAHQSRRVHSAAGPERMHRHSSRVSIDDGVSSVASRGSRGSTARPRSALRSEGQRRHRPRSNSVQFSTTITPSNVEEGQQSTGEGDEPQARRATSPLTQDAVAALPIDPSELHRQRRQRDAASATSAAHTSETSATAVTGHAASNTVVGLYTLNAVPPIVSAGPRRRSRERARSEPTPQSTRPATAEATLDFPKPPPLQLDNATVKTDVEVTEVPLSAPEQTEEMKQPPVEEKTVEEAEDKKEEEVVVQQQSAVASVERDNVPAAPAHDALDNALMALQLAEFELSLGDATHAEEEERKAVIASEVHIRAALLQKMEDERNALYARRDLESDFNLSPGTPSAVPQSLLLDSSDQVSATSDDDSVLRSLAGRPRAEGTGAKAIHTAEGAALESGSTSRSHDKHGRRHRSTSHSTQRRRRRSSSQQQAEDESAEQATKGDNEEATKGTRSTVSSTTSPIAPASTEEEAAAANVRQAREQEKQQAERLQAQQEALQQHETLVRRAIVESDEAIRGEYERLLLESATALQLRCAALEQQRVMMLQDSQRAQRLALDQIERHARTEYVEQEASERAWVTSSERVARVLAATAEAERLQREREAERLRHTLAQVRAAMEGLVHEEATQRRRLEQREDGARCGLRDEATETVASVRHTAAEAAGRRREALRRQWLLDLEELQRDEDEDRYGLREAEREQRRAMREALVRLRELDQEEAEERQRVVRQEQNQRSVLATEEGVGLMKAQLLSLHRVHRSEEEKEDLKRRQQQLLLQQQQAAANALETAESIALQQKQMEQLQDSQRAQRMALDQIERHARAEYVEQEASERAWVTSSERVARVLAATAEAERLQREREAERLRHTLAQVRAAMEGLVHEEATQRRRLEQREDGARRGLRDEATETVASVRHTAAEAAGRRREALRRQWLLDLEELQRDEDEDRYGLREAEREQRRAMRRRALALLSELSSRLVSPAAAVPAESVMPAESNASAMAVSVMQKKGSAPLPLTASKSQRVDEEDSRALQEVQDARAALQLRLSRERELAREEEILEANARLREAERRLAEEAHHRAKAEAEKAAVMQDAQRLIEEAQQRAEERIHRAQAAAAAELATAVAFMRDAEERRAAHDALLHSLAEEEQRAVLTAKLQAAERALAEAEQRAAQEIDRVRQEAIAQAAEEAARVEREAQVRAAAVAEQQRAALELQLAEHAAERAEAARRLQIVEANAAAAVERAREEARQAALQAERRLAEMRQRRAERESELRAAQAELRRARAEVKEFESSHMSYSNVDNGSCTAVSALAEEGNAAQLLASPVAPPFPSDWSSSSDTSSSQPMHDTMHRVKKNAASRQDVATEVKRPRPTVAVATSMTDAAATTTMDRAVQASVPRGAVVSTHDVATSPAATTTTTTTTTSGSGAPRVTLSESHLLRQAVREAVHELLAAQRGAHHLTERAARRVRRSVTRYEQRQAERDRAEHDLLEAETSLEVDTNDISELSAIAAPLPAQSSSHMLAMPSATAHEAPPSEVAHATAESIHSTSASSRFFDTPARRAMATPQPQQQQQQKVRKYRSNGFEVYYRPRDEVDRRNKEEALLALRGVPKATMTRPVMDYSDIFFHHGSVRAHLAARQGRRRGRSPPATSSYTGEGHPYCSAKETAAAATMTPPHRSRTRGRTRDSVLHEAEEEEAPRTADAAAQTVMTSETQSTTAENNNNATSEEEAETQKTAPSRADAAVQTSPSLEVVVEDVKATTLRTPPRATTTTTPDHVTHHTHEEGEEEDNMAAAEPKTVRKKFDAFFVPLGETASPRRPKPPTPCHYVPAPGTTRRTATTTKRRPSAEDYRASRRLFSRSRTHSAPGKTWGTEKGTATRSSNNDEFGQRGRQRTTSRPPGNKPSNSRTRAQGLPRNANRRRSSRLMPDERPGNNKAKGDEVDDEVNVHDKPTQDEEATAATARAFTPPPLPHRRSSSSKAKGKTAATTTAYFDPHHEPSHPPFSSTSQKENAGHHTRPRRTSDAAYYMPAHTKTVSPSGVSHHNDDEYTQEKAKAMYDAAAAAPAESLEEEEDYENIAALQSAWPNVYTYSVAELLAPQRRPRPPHRPPQPPRKAGTRSPFARPYAVAAGVPYGAEELRQTRAHLPRAPMKDMVQTPVVSHARRGVATAQTTLDSPPHGHTAHNAMQEDDAVTSTQVGDVPYLDHSRYVPSFAELDQRLRQLRANERAHTTSAQQQQHSHHFDPVITVTLPNKSSALADLKPVVANVNALPKQQQSLWSTSGGGAACTTSPGAMDMGDAALEGNIMRWRMRSHSRQGAAQRRVSPPWRTELNSGPLRPPWNCRQPHSPVYRPPATRTVSPQ